MIFEVPENSSTSESDAARTLSFGFRLQALEVSVFGDQGLGI